MSASLPRNCAECTVQSREDSTVRHDRGDRLCRAATDEAFGRNASELALHSGLPHYSLSRWRQNLEDQIAPPAQVRRAIVALTEIGRTFAQREAFLRPINEAAGGVLIPTEAAHEAGRPIGELLCDAMRASTALHTSVALALDDGRISVAEYEQIENYVNANRTSDALLLRRAQALCERPLRGTACRRSSAAGDPA